MLESPHRHRSLACKIIGLCALTAISITAAPTAVQARAPTRKELAEAETYVKLAKEKFRAKQYQDASELFMQVYRLSHKQSAVFNAARCKEMGGRLAEAKGLFELYLTIADSDDGKSDARAHLVGIAEQIAAQKRAKEAADAQQAQAQKQAEEAARKSEEARVEAEKRAQKLQQDKKRRATLAGLCVLPPTGVQGGDMALATAKVLQIAANEARAAAIGNVRGVADYNRAESQRGVVGTCDLACRLSVARGLGVRWALGTSVQVQNGRVRLRSVLWRTLDMGQDGTIEVDVADADALVAGFAEAAGDLFNGVRVLPLAVGKTAAAQLPGAGTPTGARIDIVTQPAGATVWLDARRIGNSPAHVDVKQGWHRLQFRLNGYRERGGLFYVAGTAAGQVSVALPQFVAPKPIATPAPVADKLAKGGTVAAAGTATGAPAGTKNPQKQPPSAAGPTVAAPAAHPPAAAPQPTAPTASPSPAQPLANGRGQPDPRTYQQPGLGAGIDDSVASAGVGWQFGFVGHFTGTASIFEPRDDTEQGGTDLSFGGGAFLHLGYASESAPHVPWVYLAAGGKYYSFQGNLAGANSVTAVSGATTWVGLGFPRLWGLRASWQRSFMNQPLIDDLDTFTTVGLGKVLSLSWFYVYTGFESRLDSQRNPAVDVYGLGPKVRLLIELGFNVGGVRLSR